MKLSILRFLWLVVAPTTLLISCGQLGPDDGAIQKSLQSKLPSYWKVNSISLDNKENLGSQSDPSIQARFKAMLQLTEDTFNDVTPAKTESWSSASQNSTPVIFLEVAERKGKVVELFGVALSERYTDSWKTGFQFDNNPTNNLGKPRSFFEGKTVLKNSPEEGAYKADLAKKEAEKLVQLSGTWEGTYTCSFDGVRGLKLVIDAKQANQVEAVFNFFPVPTGAAMKPGSYKMVGIYQGPTAQETSDTIKLKATSWIKQPPGYKTIDLEGKVDLTQGKLEGDIPDSLCRDVNLTKK
jgi:hypothetical protein